MSAEYLPVLFPAEVGDLPTAARGIPRSGLSSSAVGALSEHAAIVRLLTLGHKVAVPVVDDVGVDLIVDHAVTVQVKASGSLQRIVGDGRRPADGQFVFQTRGLRLQVAPARVFLFHAQPVDGWWVIPVAELVALGWPQSVSLHPSSRRGRSGDLNAWFGRWDVFDVLAAERERGIIPGER